MFGLTKREQRWKADQAAAELLVSLAQTAIKAKADIAIAEANNAKDDEIKALREEINELKAAMKEKQDAE